MNTVRLNITLPESLHDDMNRFSEELNEKKSHIISSALDMYFDYLDLQLAEKRLADKNEKHVPLNDFFEELGADVQH